MKDICNNKRTIMKTSEVVEALASKYSFSAEEAMEFIKSMRPKTKKVKLVIVEEPEQQEEQQQPQEEQQQPQEEQQQPQEEQQQPKPRCIKRVRFWDMCYHYVAVANDELVEYEPPLEFTESNEKFPLLL